MKSLSISEAKFIFYAHNKLDYSQLDKVRKIQTLMGNKFPESDRSIDAHSYYKALKKISDGEGTPTECVLCGIGLTDEYMMCKDCEATIHSMASRGYKELKELKDRRDSHIRKVRLIIAIAVILILLGVIGTGLAVSIIRFKAGTDLNKKLEKEGYVSASLTENPYSANIDAGVAVVEAGITESDAINAVNSEPADISSEDDGAMEIKKELEVCEIDVSALDIRDAYNMLGRDKETVLSVYGNATSVKNGVIFYEKTGLSLQYDETTGKVYQIYADREVANKNKMPMCGVYVGLDVITAINEMKKAKLAPEQMDLYTWECVCKNADKYVQIKITEEKGKVGVICINESDFLQ